jgi:hypothetical protein
MLVERINKMHIPIHLMPSDVLKVRYAQAPLYLLCTEDGTNCSLFHMHELHLKHVHIPIIACVRDIYL